MSVDLLKKIRSLNRLLQRSGANPLIFGDICILCGDLLNSNVMVVTKKGKILDVYNHDEQEGAFLGSLEKGATLSPACTAALNLVWEKMSGRDFVSSFRWKAVVTESAH